MSKSKSSNVLLTIVCVMQSAYMHKRDVIFKLQSANWDYENIKWLHTKNLQNIQVAHNDMMAVYSGARGALRHVQHVWPTLHEPTHVQKNNTQYLV